MTICMVNNFATVPKPPITLPTQPFLHMVLASCRLGRTIPPQSASPLPHLKFQILPPSLLPHPSPSPYGYMHENQVQSSSSSSRAEWETTTTVGN